jgi:hypothetical protein
MAGGRLREIFGDPIKGGIALAKEQPAGMIDEATEFQGPQVIDPFDRGLGGGDYVLAILIVEMSAAHVCPSGRALTLRWARK